MNHPEKENINLRTLLIGMFLILLGAVAFNDFLHSKDNRLLPSDLQFLMFFSLPIVIIGVFTLLRGLGKLKNKSCCQIWLYIGYVMLAVGGFPWFYTGLLTGGHSEGEAAGMLGTFIFILVGLPGLTVTITALILRAKQRKK